MPEPDQQHLPYSQIVDSDQFDVRISSKYRTASISDLRGAADFRDILELSDVKSLYGRFDLGKRLRLANAASLDDLELSETLNVFIDWSAESPSPTQVRADKTIRETVDRTKRVLYQLLARTEEEFRPRTGGAGRAAEVDRAIASVLARLSSHEAAEIERLVDEGALDVTDLLERLGVEGLVSLCLKLGAGELAWLNRSHLRPTAATSELIRSLDVIDGTNDVDGG